jgi:hypothetical protein
MQKEEVIMLKVKEEAQGAAEYLIHISDISLLETLMRSDILLLPEGQEADGTLVFRPGAKDFLDYLLSRSGSGVHVDIATEEARYVEQLLHSSDIWLPALLLLVDNPLVHEIAIVTTAHFILDKLKGVGARETSQAVVRAKILVNHKKGTTIFEYEGPPRAFEATMRNAILSNSDSRK